MVLLLKISHIMPQFYFASLRFCFLILLIEAMCFVSDCKAVVLTWDSNGSTAPNPSDGSGNWSSTGRWWNGSANQNWADTNDAVFGIGTGSVGTYLVTNNSALVQPNSVTFTNPGNYTITTDGVNAGQLAWTAPSGGIGGVSKGLWIDTNVTARIDVPWRDVGGSDIFLGSNSVLTISQGTAGNNGGVIFKGSGAALSTVNATNGILGGANGSQLPATMDMAGVTLNVINSGIVNAGTRFDIGRPVTGAPGSDGIVNVGNGGQFNANVTIGSDPNANIQLSRGGPAILNVMSGGIVSTRSAGSSGRVEFIPDSSSQATLNVSGGILNLGTGAAGTLGVSSSSLSLITLMQGSMSYGSSASAIFNLSGGTVTAQGIQIGSAGGTFTSNPTNQINVTGGILYLDALNISLPKNTGTKFALNLSGGTIAATANWSPACNAPMNLTNVNGNITFQAGDALGNPFDMAVAATLSGVGGFAKTGGGTLTLSGTNTYVGATTINGGTILLNGGGSITSSSGFSITNNGMLTLLNTAAANKADRINNSAPVTMNGGAFAFINDGSTASFSETVGALTINSGANVVTVFPATNGQTSALSFSSVTNYGGSVDFQMGSAGTSQNKVFFTATPVLGGWITVNGSAAAYDSINGLHEATIFTDISALGSTISNAPASNVRINSTGSGGNIQLDSTVTAVNSLQQNTTTPATVDTATKTFSVNQITINAGSQSFSIGATPGSGVLMAGSMGGNLTLINNSSFSPGLVINASLQDDIFPSSLTILGSGAVTLASPNNTYTGGTTISNGTLVVTTGTTAAMLYTNIGGTLKVNLGAAGTILPMNGFTFGGNNPQLTVNLNGITNSSVPVINISGNLMANGDIYMNVTNPAPGTTVLLQYSGSRLGSGRFLLGNVPAGVGIIDDPADKEVSLIYLSGPTVITPSLDTNKIVVAIATPQQYGAVGDGVTDDSVAFQDALNAVNNPSGAGGGVLYVPAGVYAFSNSIIIPQGVTLQGNWTDWSQGTNGVAGTLFKVYTGAGQSNGTPFITINGGAVKGVSIWYPNQDPANITSYPFTIYIPKDDSSVEDVALINSYQGIFANSCAKHVISDVFGSPLYTGFQVDGEADISHQENVRFSPDFWPKSLLPGAPAIGGPHATWMRANGVAERLYRCDGENCMDVNISGYNVGFSALVSASGAPDASFYGGYISNCATAYLDGSGGGNTGEEFTDFTLDGDVAVDRSTNLDASAYFHTCQIIGHSGLAIRQTGGNSSTMQFQNCNVSGTVKVDGGIANFVNSSFTVPAGSNHCAMASGAIYAGFTGCIFNPARNISNAADARRLVIDGRRATTSPLPLVKWADIQTDWLTRRPAKLDIFFATNAVGDGVADDTAAIQSALNTAGANGGGIVYVPGGAYKLTGTLDVPSGVELRGSFPSRHPASLNDGHFKVTMLHPYGGVGTTNGPPAIALEANSGVVGLSVSYELQSSNILVYPPTIQGRGANVYAYGIQCPNAYWYVDLNTYTCTNHFMYDVDGWSLEYGFTIGNGSCGSIIRCMANSSYWGANAGSASTYPSASQPPVQNYVEHNQEWFLLGDCSELMVKNFEIFSHTFMHCISQNNSGPRITGILTMCDAEVECFRFESASNTLVNIVNPEWMVTTRDYSDLTNYGVISTSDFQGKARFFNAPLWGGRDWDYVIQGGDVGFELTHAGYLSANGSKVDGGVAHFINCGLEGGTSSYYTVPFNSTSNGVPGKISEIIGCYAWTGVTNSLVNAGNPVNQWGNFGINKLVTQTPFNVTSPKLLLAAGAQNISLIWTNNMGAFNLCSSPSLSSPTWSVMTNTPYFGTNRWTVTDSINNSGQLFYRLQQ
jgi:autotransporter-associated beta strand protein